VIIRGAGRCRYTTIVVLSSAVAGLSDADYRQVLAVVHEAAAVDGPVAFPKPVLDVLRRLVACDVVAYHERAASGRMRVVWTGEPQGSVTRELRRAQRRYAHEDPLTPATGARKYSDFLTEREFHRCGLYQEVARPLGVEDMFRVWLDPRGDGRARLEFDRAQRDFCERDRAVLDVLLPLLRQFRLNALRRRKGSNARLLSPREHEVLALVAEGRTNIEIGRLLWISPGTVRKHLENAYEKLGVHTRTAAVAAVKVLESRPSR
jgi:DNA-binding CsgD family transcriptional regulator